MTDSHAVFFIVIAIVAVRYLLILVTLGSPGAEIPAFDPPGLGVKFVDFYGEVLGSNPSKGKATFTIFFTFSGYKMMDNHIV